MLTRFNYVVCWFVGFAGFFGVGWYGVGLFGGIALTGVCCGALHVFRALCGCFCPSWCDPLGIGGCGGNLCDGIVLSVCCFKVYVSLMIWLSWLVVCLCLLVCLVCLAIAWTGRKLVATVLLPIVDG